MSLRFSQVRFGGIKRRRLRFHRPWAPHLCQKAVPLKLELEAELHYAWPSDRVSDRAEVSGIRQIAGRVGEVDIIEKVENIPTELQPNALGDQRALREAEVKALLV